jgi:uncharacterized membrane protein
MLHGLYGFLRSQERHGARSWIVRIRRPVEISVLLSQVRGGAERIAMAAAIVLLIGLMFLVTQLMGQGVTGAWPSITIASELGIPADQVYSGWAILNRPVQFLLGDVQLWVVLVFAAALIYWLTDWTQEQLSRHLSKPAPAPVPTRPSPELTDSGPSS